MRMWSEQDFQWIECHVLWDGTIDRADAARVREMAAAYLQPASAAPVCYANNKPRQVCQKCKKLRGVHLLTDRMCAIGGCAA
jgi:hypothetical protein